MNEAQEVPPVEPVKQVEPLDLSETKAEASKVPDLILSSNVDVWMLQLENNGKTIESLVTQWEQAQIAKMPIDADRAEFESELSALKEVRFKIAREFVVDVLMELPGFEKLTAQEAMTVWKTSTTEQFNKLTESVKDRMFTLISLVFAEDLSAIKAAYGGEPILNLTDQDLKRQRAA